MQFIDGELVELATDGSRSTWAEVLEWDPPSRLALAWHPGGAPEDASRIDVTFAVDAAGTRVELRHTGWEQFGEQGMQRRRNYVGPSAWGHVLDHFADSAELRSQPLDLEALIDAYETFFAEAEARGFAPAPEGEWDAAQVIAHVALNDLAMTAVSNALVFQREPLFENATCQDPANLATVIESCGDWDGLLTHGRSSAARARGVSWPATSRPTCISRPTSSSSATCGSDRSPDPKLGSGA